MKGYFGRLIQQTGIKLNTGKKNRPVISGQSFIQPKQKTEIPQMHTEEEKLIVLHKEPDGEENHRDGDVKSDTLKPIETGGKTSIHIEEKMRTSPQEGQTSRKIHDRNENAEISLLASKSEEVGHPVIDKKIENNVIQSSQISTSEMEKPNQKECKTEGLKTTGYNRDIKSSLEEKKHRQKNSEEGMLESEKTVEVNKAKAPEEIHRKPVVEKDGSKHEKYKEVILPDNDTAPDSKFNQIQNWQSSIKEVRDWIAGTPVNDTKAENRKTNKKSHDKEKGVLDSFNKREQALTSHQRQREFQQREEADIHDFHLSIGTISLTIEGTQKEAQSKQPLQVIKSEKISDRKSETSSLSRHYIRIR